MVTLKKIALKKHRILEKLYSSMTITLFLIGVIIVIETIAIKTTLSLTKNIFIIAAMITCAIISTGFVAMNLENLLIRKNKEHKKKAVDEKEVEEKIKIRNSFKRI